MGNARGGLRVSFALALISATASATYVRSADYVIVGAGTAGCALAARLCDVLPFATVTVLERSERRTPESEFIVRAPRNMDRAWTDPAVTEMIQSEPNANIGGRRVELLTGNTLGGSSSINGAQFTRPPNGTVSSWGIEGLDDDSATRLYRKSAAMVGSNTPAEALQQTYTRDWLKAANRSGFEVITSAPEVLQDSAAWINEIAVDGKGFRRDSCTAYLSPVLQGTCAGRLRVLQGATATKVVMGKGVSEGVRYVSWKGSKKRRGFIRALREVIVCAGPYGSPKLLQLSGIGPKSELEIQGVRVHVDLPVGRKTQVRPISALIATYLGRPLPPESNRTLLDEQATVEQWSTGRGGPLGVSSLATQLK